jgi:hypothetical protein
VVVFEKQLRQIEKIAGLGVAPMLGRQQPEQFAQASAFPSVLPKGEHHREENDTADDDPPLQNSIPHSARDAAPCLPCENSAKKMKRGFPGCDSGNDPGNPGNPRNQVAK